MRAVGAVLHDCTLRPRFTPFAHKLPEDSRAASDAPDITFWSIWDHDQLAGCAALKTLDASHGEIKSMRTAPAFRRRGVARQLLAHLIAAARQRGMQRLSLETGPQTFFVPAHRLYAEFGFAPCAPFADYGDDPYSVFMTLVL